MFTVKRNQSRLQIRTWTSVSSIKVSCVADLSIHPESFQHDDNILIQRGTSTELHEHMHSERDQILSKIWLKMSSSLHMVEDNLGQREPQPRDDAPQLGAKRNKSPCCPRNEIYMTAMSAHLEARLSIPIATVPPVFLTLLLPWTPTRKH